MGWITGDFMKKIFIFGCFLLISFSGAQTLNAADEGDYNSMEGEALASSQPVKKKGLFKKSFGRVGRVVKRKPKVQSDAEVSPAVKKPGFVARSVGFVGRTLRKGASLSTNECGRSIPLLARNIISGGKAIGEAGAQAVGAGIGLSAAIGGAVGTGGATAANAGIGVVTTALGAVATAPGVVKDTVKRLEPLCQQIERTHAAKCCQRLPKFRTSCSKILSFAEHVCGSMRCLIRVKNTIFKNTLEEHKKLQDSHCCTRIEDSGAPKVIKKHLGTICREVSAGFKETQNRMESEAAQENENDELPQVNPNARTHLSGARAAANAQKHKWQRGEINR